VRFKTANVRLGRSNAYSKSQRLLIKDELHNKHKERSRVNLQISSVKFDILKCLRPLDACSFRLWVSTSANKYDSSVKSVHNAKLAKLSPDFNIDPLKPDEVILNLSSYVLSEAEKNILVKGLNYTLETSNISDVEFRCSLELAARTIKNNLFEAGSWNDVKKVLVSPSIRNNKLNDADKRGYLILKNLGRNDNLYISKPDKGNGVVILNRSDYINKMNTILNDNTKFVSVDENAYKLTQRLEARLNKTLLTFMKSDKINKNTYEKLRAVGSSPGKLYGLPKTHKTGVPMRPILSALTCHNYNLAKFLVPLLSPIATSSYTVSDVFSFVKQLQDRTDSNKTLMISLDVENLFTNVPVLETIEIILNRLFPDNSVTYHGFTRGEFNTLLKLAVEDSYFSFNGKYFRQIDGMAMGSPLGPLFANIFLSHYESQWLENSPVKPLLYKRYVDDTLWLLPENSDIAVLMHYMNSRHNSMRFTYESEKNNCINFIGLTICHDIAQDNHKYITSVYRKPTSTSLFTNFNSFTPLSYRLSVFKSLIYRAYKLCSNWKLFHDEITLVRSMLLRNAYPSRLLDSIILKSITNLITPRPALFGPNKERLYIGLPYAGKSSDSLRRTLKQIFKKYIPNKELIVFYKPGRRISSFFKIKDPTPFDLRSGLVYEYTCGTCHCTYVGQTTRHLRHRIAEHAGVSHLTGRPVKNLVHSSIRDHLIQCQGGECSSRNFKIIATGRCEKELLIREKLLINDKKPSLNANSGSFELLLA